MIPDGVPAAVLLLSLVPGWLYLRLQERLQASPSRSGLGELLEVVAVGAATTGLSILLFVLAPRRWMRFAVDPDEFAKRGGALLADDPRQGIYSVGVIIGTACLLAFIAYGLQRLRRPAEFRNVGSAWVYAIGDRPRGQVPFVGVELVDGRLMEGLLHSFSMTDDSQDRDIALQPPIRITRPGQAAQSVALDRVVIPDRSITAISVVHVPEREKPRRWRKDKPQSESSTEPSPKALPGDEQEPA